MIPPFSGETGGEWDCCKQEAACCLGTAWLGVEPALLKRRPHPAGLGQSTARFTVNCRRGRPQPQGDAFESACAACPRTHRRRLPGRAGPMWTMPAIALRPRNSSHLSGRVRWDRTVALETLPSGEKTRWLQHRHGSGPCNASPASFIAGVWDLLHHCRGPGDRRQTGTRNSARERL